MMLWGWNSGGMGAGGWVLTIIWAIFWVAVFVAIILLIRHLVVRSDETRWSEEERHAPQGHHMWPRSNAMNILEERYARGEIDREEFLSRKADLS